MSFQCRMIKVIMLADSAAFANIGPSWPCSESQIHLNIELGIVRFGPDASAVMKPSIIERSIASSGTESLIRKSSSWAISASVRGRLSNALSFIRFPMKLHSQLDASNSNDSSNVCVFVYKGRSGHQFIRGAGPPTSAEPVFWGTVPYSGQVAGRLNRGLPLPSL